MRPTLLALLATACAEEPPTTPGGTHGPPGTPSTAPGPCHSSGDDDLYVGPTSIDEALLFCHGDALTVDVCTIGWTGRALVRLATGTIEEHDLPSVAFDDGRHWDQLLLELDTTGVYGRNASTEWVCDLGVPDAAILVSDLDGVPADCVQTGEPVPGTEDWDCHAP